MNKKLSFILFLLIMLIAIILRLWQLGSVPPSPDWDEASLGYNAYSIMMTGKDEYGNFLPVILRSFDDYKPALYAYLIIPFIKLFGLNIIAVRLPSVLFGIIAVVATYFLVRELFKESKLGEYLALLSSFLLSISPWHIQFSRIAFEAQVGLSLNILSVLFLLKGMKKRAYLLLSAIFATFSIYVYQSEKVYLPILFLFLALIYFKDLIKIPKKWLVLALIVGIVISAPMLSALISDKNSLMRAKGVLAFSDQTQFLKRNALKVAQDQANHDYIGMILDNRRIEFGKTIISGYISHFNLNWLFITGDTERHHAPFMGLLYLFEFPFMFLGIYLLFASDFSRKTKFTIFSIFLIAPLPASITSGVPHAVRTINFLPTFQIFSALGLITAIFWIKNMKFAIFNFKLKYLIFGFYSLFIIFNISYYLNQYFVQQNYFYSESWQYGYQQAIDFMKPIEKNYNSIIVSNVAPLDQSYIFFLYYLKYDPNQYLKSGGTGSGGFKEDHKGFGKFTFRPIQWEKEAKGNLFIGTAHDFSGNFRVLNKINYLDRSPNILIVEKI